MSRVWFTSDLHIAHRRVALIRGFVRDDEPDTEAHDAWLAELWDSTVGPLDTVWVLGDIAMNSRRGLEWLAKRPGVKRLIAGNHDSIHPMHAQAHKEQARYAEVFASTSVAARLKLEGSDVLLSHMPYLEQEDGTGRRDGSYAQWRLPDLGVPLIHGHTHGPEKSHGTQLHVGVDAWRELVSQEFVVAWLGTEEESNG